MARLRDRGSKSSLLLKERPAPTENPELKPPLFSFEFMQADYCVSECTSDERSQVLSKLRTLSQMSWQQIKQAPRHGLGFEIIGRPSFKAAIPAFVTDDTNLISFRAIGKAPMVGYRDGRVFHILWIDRDFTVYDHGS
ncbi:hypothetical protein AN459_31440 [Pseudomonas aeruginosa]|uniref:Uncharacterized protein n=2 Tax=Pseudomonas aeruginosa TaxID=287 RepID=A0A263PK13_PSEAI|nr:hypothetical protein [Pseudomonas aeruginosa]AIL00127.1 hypothetical protein P797_33595 [Pseudomonas aeruginosa VRFPA04]KSC53349.1 hypothetical protein AO882_03425 [Pseudomonas paraeruginosa]QBI77276.1 hypothetical protein [Pseudomonas phage vB_Pae_CF34a]QBI77449.1 hypothetical protein [Pseudomonas phage vB_Pae_CF55b]QBI77501.1 hypothetical protein [Pseudomonas phage vB_Pae_CF60a]QBI77579.1 hypothetical protein [Pseudomonas phage vB_Pae_CF67a]QBI77612.1 hypothetical protein [Pseudomonas p